MESAALIRSRRRQGLLRNIENLEGLLGVLDEGAKSVAFVRRLIAEERAALARLDETTGGRKGGISS